MTSAGKRHWLANTVETFGSLSEPPSETFTRRMERGRWHLLVALRPGTGSVRFTSPRVALHRNMPWATRSLLLYSDEAIGLFSSRPFDVMPVDMLALTKLVAFHDDGCSIDEHATRSVGDCVVASTHFALEEPSEARRWMVRGLMQEDHVIRDVCDALRRTEEYRLVRFLLSQDPSVKASHLSERYGLSPTHFRRKCRQVLGRSLKGELRLLRAARSLLEYGMSDEPFTTVAADHGYSSAAHFSSEVRSLFGKSPSELYRPGHARKDDR